MFFKKDNMIT